MTLQKSWSSSSANKLTIVLFALYLIVLLWIILFKLGVQFSYMENRIVNLIPFAGSQTNSGELIANIAIFIPLGIYAGLLFTNRTSAAKIFLFALVSLLFEVLQFVMKVGAFDITDIITNTAGGIVGLLLFKIIEKAFTPSSKVQKIINLFAATGTIALLVLLVLLKLNMLPVRYQ